MFYKSALAAVLTFDLTNPSSFEAAKEWLAEIRKSAPKEIFIVLAGNKTDLEEKVRCSDVNKFAESEGLTFVSCSAKDGTGINNIFDIICKQMVKTTQEENSVEEVRRGSMRIKANLIIHEAKKPCC